MIHKLWQSFHCDVQFEKGTQRNLLSTISTLMFLQCFGDENALSEET